MERKKKVERTEPDVEENKRRCLLIEVNLIRLDSDAGAETLRPLLPTLARLNAAAASTPAPSASAPAPVKPQSLHLSNSRGYGHQQQQQHQQQHRQHQHDDDDIYLTDGEAVTPTPTSPNSLARMDDYAASLGLLAAPAGGVGGGGADLTRRPSVAVGGVRSPRSSAVDDATVHQREQAHHSMPYHPQRYLIFFHLFLFYCVTVFFSVIEPSFTIIFVRQSFILKFLWNFFSSQFACIVMERKKPSIINCKFLFETNNVTNEASMAISKGKH